jgi:hypothetical protein
MHASTNSLQCLRSPSRPKRLYHYVRWHWLAQQLKSGTLTLNDPMRWDDPTEWLWTNWIHEHVAKTVLCMCWTRTCRSEAQWRVERFVDGTWPALDRTVVRIRSNFDRLRRTVERSLDLHGVLEGKSFLVPIKYLRDCEVEHRFDELARTRRVGQEAAFALSFKRYPYRYEREIRWVHVTKKDSGAGGRTAIRVDWNTLIDQIMIDPRVDTATAVEIREAVKIAGFKNEVLHSRLFELPTRLRPHAVRPLA